MRDSTSQDQLVSVQEQTSARSQETDVFFEELMQTECSYVWTSLRRLGVPLSDCEDLMQEVFVRVHRSLASLDRSRTARPWLFGFAMRVASEHRRLARHKREVMTEADVADGRPPADEQIMRAERRRVVALALDGLDVDKRAVLILHDIDGTPVPDIAQALGIAEGTAYSRLRAGRAQFAAAIRRLVARGGLP
jgi:RNA polymerase sigma-70 factor (ECF subfamily)